MVNTFFVHDKKYKCFANTWELVSGPTVGALLAKAASFSSLIIVRQVILLFKVSSLTTNEAQDQCRVRRKLAAIAAVQAKHENEALQSRACNDTHNGEALISGSTHDESLWALGFASVSSVPLTSDPSRTALRVLPCRHDTLPNY